MPPKKRKAPLKSATADDAPIWTVTGSELVKAFQHIFFSLPQCHDQWFTDEDWCSILPTYWSSLRNYKDQVTPAKFDRAIKSHFGETSGDRGESNPNGVYAVQHSTKDKKDRRWCFLITTKYKCPLPPSSPHFYVSDISKVLKPVLPNYLPVAARMADSIRNETYLDSPEAWRQFMPSNIPIPKDCGKPTGSEVKAMIEARLEVCQSGIQNWWEVVEDGTEDDVVTEHKTKKIVIKCHVVYAALRKALDTMGDKKNTNRLTWGQCCEYAIDAMKNVGFAGKDLPSVSTVMKSHSELRENNNKFPHPNEKANKKKAAKEEGAKLEEEGELEEE
jgi:hypothetical protein